MVHILEKVFLKEKKIVCRKGDNSTFLLQNVLTQKKINMYMSKERIGLVN